MISLRRSNVSPSCSVRGPRRLVFPLALRVTLAALTALLLGWSWTGARAATSARLLHAAGAIVTQTDAPQEGDTLTEGSESSEASDTEDHAPCDLPPPLHVPTATSAHVAGYPPRALCQRPAEAVAAAHPARGPPAR